MLAALTVAVAAGCGLSRGSPSPSLAPSGVTTTSTTAKAVAAYAAGGRLTEALGGGVTREVGASGQAADPSWSYDGAWLSYTCQSSPTPSECSTTQGGFAAHPPPQRCGGLLLPPGPPSVHVVRADGSGDHAVAGAESPVEWSPSADVLAFTTQSGAALQIAAADGLATDLVKAGGGSIESFVWSHDGTALAYALHSADPSTADQVFSVAADGSRYQRWPYVPPEHAGIILAGWWPDGTGILAWPDPDHSASIAADGLPLVSVRLAGGPAQTLATTLPYRPWVRWSPDGRSVAVVAGAGREPWQAKSLAVCSVPGGGCTPVPQAPGTVSVDPAWSPDGSRIAFVRAPEHGSPGAGADFGSWYPSRRLWVTGPGGADAHEVPGAASGVAAPAWSRDGGSLGYSTGSSVNSVPATGGSAAQVAGPLSGGPAPGWPLIGKAPWTGLAAWAPSWRSVPTLRGRPRPRVRLPGGF